MSDLEHRLAELAARDQGWDSYGAQPLQPDIADRVRAVMRAVSGAPAISMTSEGGISLEWEVGNSDYLEITIDPDEVTAVIDGRDLAES